MQLLYLDVYKPQHPGILLFLLIVLRIKWHEHKLHILNLDSGCYISNQCSFQLVRGDIQRGILRIDPTVLSVATCNDSSSTKLLDKHYKQPKRSKVRDNILSTLEWSFKRKDLGEVREMEISQMCARYNVFFC